MGMGKDGIMRFPRLVRRGMTDKDGHRLNNLDRIKLQVGAGIVPKRGYDKITKKQKKLIRLIVNGASIRRSCREVGCDQNTYYRWMHGNKKFQAYYHAYAERVSGLAAARLEARVPRAVRIVEESMESPDQYFKYEVAKNHLNGMGLYKKHGEVKSDRKISFQGKLDGQMKHENVPQNEDFLKALVGVMTNMAAGTKRVEPKVIDVTQMKALPGSSVAGEEKEVQEEQHAEAS